MNKRKRHKRAGTINKLPREERDWAGLPYEILNLISKKVLDLYDLARFRVICRPWRSASSHLPLQLPWFITGPNIISEIHTDKDIYSPIFGRGPRINVRKWHRKFLVGACHHYLLARGKKSMLSLINPLTGREFFLPRIKVDYYGLKLLSIRSDPISNRDYVAIHGCKEISGILALCQVGDPCWKIVQLEEGYVSAHHLVCLYNDMFFVYNRRTKITRVISVEGALNHMIPPQQYENYIGSFDFFVESSGKLLGITTRPTYGCVNNPREFGFLIHELVGNENPQWVPTNCIGDQFLLIINAPRASNGISLKASDFPGFRSNCIYYYVYAMAPIGYASHGHFFRFDINKYGGERLCDFPCQLRASACFLPSLQ